MQLIDEFDVINDQFKPFWGLKPATVRARVKEALSHDNGLLEVTVRNGKASFCRGKRSYSEKQHWIRDSFMEMMASFAHYLPDMGLAINTLDEPRVVVPSDDLSRLLYKARAENLRASEMRGDLVGEFTRPPPSELINAHLIERTGLTRFNSFPWQATWTVSRSSCPADSPTRSLDDSDEVDQVGKYRVNELGFIYNFTAMSDICLSPTLRYKHGFFVSPDTYSVIQEPLPVFSQAKVSSYNDILYPSPYYWRPVVPYYTKDDKEWADKRAQVYWRGSTTGGHLINRNWRRHHRERMVEKINFNSRPLTLAKHGGVGGNQTQWEAMSVPRISHNHLFDVHFTDFVQCEHDDCKDAKRLYGTAKRGKQKEARNYKYLLDMDGNSFSGRFYAFLRSKSLTFKQTLFREWHSEWLKPWVHYVPLSQEGDDLLEAVRFFNEDGPDYGKGEGRRIASQAKTGRAQRREGKTWKCGCSDYC